MFTHHVCTNSIRSSTLRDTFLFIGRYIYQCSDRSHLINWCDTTCVQYLHFSYGGGISILGTLDDTSTVVCMYMVYRYLCVSFPSHPLFYPATPFLPKPPMKMMISARTFSGKHMLESTACAISAMQKKGRTETEKGKGSLLLQPPRKNRKERGREREIAFIGSSEDIFTSGWRKNKTRSGDLPLKISYYYSHLYICTRTVRLR